MKRPNSITTKNLGQVEAIAAKVKDKQAKIQKLIEELQQIDRDNRWVSYIGSEMTETLNEDEQERLYEATQTIIYADRRI